MRTANHHIALGIILVGYFFIAIAYALVNPLWEAPDEIHHFPMVQYLQTHSLQLPSQEIGTVGLWQQEGNQPPLYYMLGALLISPIDTSDINSVMRINPHADIGIIRPDGNVNRLVHLPDESFPNNGSILATYILRFFSIFLGGCTVFVTYCIGRELFPEQPIFAITAAGLNAFLPMYVYISASVNNDNLSNLLSNLLVLLLIKLIQVKDLPSHKSYILIGIVTGAGLLAKLNIGFLIPIVAMILIFISIRFRDWKPVVIGGFISGGLTILIAGWWYYRNWTLYGDPTALDRFLDIVGRRAVPADLPQLWTERISFIRTFWGLFGSVNVPMHETLYIFFEWLTVFLLVIIAIYGLYSIFQHIISSQKSSENQNLVGVRGISILWIVLTFIALLRWTSITPASQGRLIYGAISCIMVWFTIGLLWWIPAKFRTWIGYGWVLGFAMISFAQPFLTIAPAYALPDAIPSGTSEIIFSSENSAIGIINSTIVTLQASPDSYVEISVEIDSITPHDRDWSIFVHLVTKEGIIVGQRDIYPARGLIATSDLEAGFSWRNPIAIYVSKTAYTPNTVDVRLGWYHLPTGERMTLENGDEMLTIGQVDLVPNDNSEIPNPLDINFGNQIALIGYDISSLNPTVGETIELTLYWQALKSIEKDYVVFANIIDPETLTKFADSNAMPVQWTRPTTTWEIGEIVEDVHTLTISENAVAGVYPIEVGLYLQEDGFPRLGVMGTYDNFIYLNPVRIESEGD